MSKLDSQSANYFKSFEINETGGNNLSAGVCFLFPREARSGKGYVYEKDHPHFFVIDHLAGSLCVQSIGTAQHCIRYASSEINRPDPKRSHNL